MVSEQERQKAYADGPRVSYFAEGLAASRAFREEDARRKVVVKAGEMPWEDSPHGLIKWLVHERMGTREYCLDVFMLFLEGGGWSGKHAHMSEELLYVVEGEGYDLHWDVDFECQDRFIWKWKSEPSRHPWRAGQFIYVPPYTLHQHFNAQPDRPARLISATSRIVKAMGFDWIEQVEEGSHRTRRQSSVAQV